MKTALLVIDVQNIYTDPESDYFCQDAEETVNRISRITSKAEASGVPILFVRHVNKLTVVN